MTLNDIIAEVDNQKPNQYNDAEKVRWLSVCEGKIVDRIIRNRVGSEDVSFSGYTIADIDHELIAPDTYADLYKYYLFAMIDATNGELQRYQGSMQLFNTMLKDFADWYGRTHTPYGNQLVLF